MAEYHILNNINTNLPSCLKMARKLSFWILAVSSDAVIPKNVFCMPPAKEATIAMMNNLYSL
jgi:hypothetical protein